VARYNKIDRLILFYVAQLLRRKDKKIGVPEAAISMKWATAILLMLIIAAFAVIQPITIFVVPPIGAVPEGRTVVLLRYSRNEKGDRVTLNTKLIDSADAICQRNMGYVNLLCCGMALATVAGGGIILLRLPYSSLLQQIAEGT